MFTCTHCGRNAHNIRSHVTHERACPKNVNRKYKNGMTGKPGKNQYIKAKELNIEPYGMLTAGGRERIRNRAKSQRHTTETKQKLSRIAKERGLGGHTSKKCLYFRKNNGDIVYLQSSYETRFAELLEKLNIPWSRPEPLLWTDKNGESHRYYPDFQIDDRYFDTKNSYLANKDSEKIRMVSEQNNVLVQIVTIDDINETYIRSLLV